MHRILLFVIANMLLFSFGCSKNSRQEDPFSKWACEKDKIRVLSTTAMIGDLVQEIGGERVSSLILIQGDLDPHSYELVKGDDEKFSRAQIVFCNGLGLECGASLSHLLKEHSHTVYLGHTLQKKRPDQIVREGVQIDPHIWMDMSLWAEMIQPIQEALSQLDPQGKEGFLSRAADLRKKMLEEDAALQKAMHQVPKERRHLITSHDAFNYFSRHYLAEEGEEEWKDRFTSPEGIAPDGQLSSADVERIVNKIAACDVRVVFPESNVARHSLLKVIEVCRKKGIEVRLSKAVLYTDAMGPPGSDADTYLKMMRKNVETLVGQLMSNEGHEKRDCG